MWKERHTFSGLHAFNRFVIHCTCPCFNELWGYIFCATCGKENEIHLENVARITAPHLVAFNTEVIHYGALDT